jgi:hypothetical protein
LVPAHACRSPMASATTIPPTTSEDMLACI